MKHMPQKRLHPQHPKIHEAHAQKAFSPTPHRFMRHMPKKQLHSYHLWGGGTLAAQLHPYHPLWAEISSVISWGIWTSEKICGGSLLDLS